MKKHSLSVWIPVGMVAGVLTGILFGKFESMVNPAPFSSDIFLLLEIIPVFLALVIEVLRLKLEMRQNSATIFSNVIMDTW